MIINGKVHLMFEQSGTFKNEFIKLGIPAEDYDIQNNFGQTDHVVDLFQAIEDAYEGKPSLFDGISPDDLIVAFFPCIYFSSNNTLHFDGSWLTYHQRGMSELEINDAILKRGRERQHFYEVLLKMFSVCTMKGLRLIVENPYATHHYLHANFPYKPKVIDTDRQRRGDYFKKPTQYFFHNCEPTNGFTSCRPKLTKTVKQLSGGNGGLCNEERSLISPDYARNFICDCIIGKPQAFTQQALFG
jgi:hypothetical protein